MATVELRFSAQPEHVRTARLVAAAVARRAGVDEAALDEVRLAVGEACSRAVGLHRSHGITAPIKVVLTEEEKSFSIEVGDEVPGPGSEAESATASGTRGATPGGGSMSRNPRLTRTARTRWVSRSSAASSMMWKSDRQPTVE